MEPSLESKSALGALANTVGAAPVPAHEESTAYHRAQRPVYKPVTPRYSVLASPRTEPTMDTDVRAEQSFTANKMSIANFETDKIPVTA
jgi:hypothetical protein